MAMLRHWLPNEWWGWGHNFGYPFIKVLKFNKNFDDVSISEKIQNFDDFSGFFSPEFDSFLRYLSVFRLKCNGQHSSIPKCQIKIPETFL